MKRIIVRGGLLAILFACAIGWVGFLGLTGAVQFASGTASPASDGSAGSISFVDQVQFPAIRVYLKIQDKDGATVNSLSEDRFEVTEDGTVVKIDDFISAGEQPITAILLIDRSGSMMEYGKMLGAQAAANAFLDNLKPGRDKVGVTAFDTQQMALQPVKLVTAEDIRLLKDLINAVAPDGGTALHSAALQAAQHLSGIPGRRVIIALTDGMDNESRAGDLDRLLDVAARQKIAVYTIGLGEDVNAVDLSALARRTGGKYYFAPSASQLADLYRKIAVSLQSEYSLSYVSPTPGLDGTTRSIQVTIDLPAGAATAPGSYAVGGVLTAKSNLPVFAFLLVPLAAALAVPTVARRKRRTVVEESASPVAGNLLSTFEPEWGAPRQPVAQPPPLPSDQPASTVPCPKCGAPLRPEARFCPNCGHNPMQCPACGVQLKQRAARFCGSCGARLGQAPR